MSKSQLIFTHINISKALLNNDIHTLKMGVFVVIIHMNVSRAVFLIFYDDSMITQTLNKSN